MTKFMKTFKEKELKRSKKISQKEYQKAKENLDKDVFEKEYREVDCE